MWTKASDVLTPQPDTGPAVKVWMLTVDTGRDILEAAHTRGEAVRAYEERHPGEMVLRAVDVTDGA